jgi:hypothetical protein
MTNDSTAPAATPADPASEHDYEVLVSALSQSARGRAFLDEHARRARHADTRVLLAAIARLEALVRAQAQAVPHTAATAKPADPPSVLGVTAPDPLAALKALSEDERLALFT